jgi:hypothetical protein
MTLRTILLFLIVSTLSLPATVRPWKSADGQRSTPGEFVRRNATSITIRKTNGDEQVIPIDQLHPNDRAWVQAKHPLDSSKVPANPAAAVKGAVFDQLVFGDTRDKVLAKLKASQCVEVTVDDVFLGRTGFNGVFRTRQKIGKLSATLSFDWTEAGRLKEITLQSESLPASAYPAEIEPSWQAFIKLLGTLYGKPVQAGTLPRIETLAAGTYSPTHLWTLDEGGSVLLGTAREGSNYQIVVRFTQEKIQPVEY